MATGDVTCNITNSISHKTAFFDGVDDYIIIGDFPKAVKEKLEDDFTVIDKDKINTEGNIGKISKKELKKIQKKGFKNWLKKYKERFNE